MGNVIEDEHCSSTPHMYSRIQTLQEPSSGLMPIPIAQMGKARQGTCCPARPTVQAVSGMLGSGALWGRHSTELGGWVRWVSPGRRLSPRPGEGRWERGSHAGGAQGASVPGGGTLGACGPHQLALEGPRHARDCV